MTQHARIFLALILTFALLLCACDTEISSRPSGNNQEYSYKKTKLAEDSEIWDICVYNDVEYLLTRTEGGYAVSCLDNDQAHILCKTLDEDTYWLCIASGSTGLYLLESNFVETEDGYGEEFCITVLNHNGSVSNTIQLGYPGEAVYDIEVDDSGRIYVQYAEFVAVLDSAGNLLQELSPAHKYVEGLVRSSSGIVFISSISNDTKTLQSFSDDGLTVAKEYELPADSVCGDGAGDYDLLVYVNDGIYGVVDARTDRLMECQESGISFFLLQKLFLKSSRDFLCLDNGTLLLLCQVPTDEIVPKESLTMAVMGDNNLQWMIRLYNAESGKYYIEVKDYLVDGKSFADGIEQLNMDIISGSAPDLINFAGTSFAQYAEKGLLEDIGALIASEPGMEMADYFLLDALMDEDSLYVASPAFMLMTWCGLSANFSGGDGCSYAELEKFLVTNPESALANGMTAEEALVNFVSFSSDELVDWKNGKALFDSDVFMKMLAIAAESANREPSFDPESTALECLMNRTQLLMPTTLMSIQDISKLDKESNDSLVFVGWPTPDGSNGTVAYLADPVAICAESGKKDGAWDFIKYIMNDEAIQRSVAADCFPINRSLFSSTKDQDAAYEKFQLLADNVHCVYEYNSTITDIVKEEAAAYFAGNKTAEAVAEVIQNRVQTYLNERG